MADEPTDVNDQIMSDLTDDMQTSSVEESSTEETEKSEVAETTDAEKPAEESESQPEAEGGQEQPEPTEEPKDKDKPLVEEKPLAEKSVNRFQKLANENRQLREANEQLIAQIYSAQTPEELVDEGESEAMAEIKSLKQQREIDKYVQQVTDGQTYVENESQAVLDDFDGMFNPESPNYKANIAVQAARQVEPLLIRDNNIPEIDPDGQPTGKGVVIGARSSIYDLYQTLAEAAQASSVEGQIKGQKATEKMLASADAPTSAAPPKEKKDPILELWSD